MADNDKKNGFTNTRAALGAAVMATAAGLSGCFDGNQPLPVPPTAEQRASCHAEGQQTTRDTQDNLNRGEPGAWAAFQQWGENNKKQNSPVAYADQMGKRAEAICRQDETIRNTREAQIREAAAAARQNNAQTNANIPSPADAPAPVAADAGAPSSATTTPLPPVEIVKPTQNIGTLPTYSANAVVAKEELDKNSFGDAKMMVLAKTVMQSCDHGGCATDGNANDIMQGQFVAQTAVKFGMNPQGASDPMQAVVAAGKLQAYNNKELTRLLGAPPQDSQLALASKLGKDAVAALVQNPDKVAADVLTTAYKGDAKAAVDAVDNIKKGALDMTARHLLELQQVSYDAASAKDGATIVGGIMAKNGGPRIDSTTMRNTAGTSLDATPFGAPSTAQPDEPFGTSMLKRLIHGKQPDASASAAR